MDQDALAEALANLAANQQLQQQQFQIQQQQMRQQQDVLTALANRLLAAPVVAAPVNPVPAPAVAIRTTLDSDVKYSGSKDESLQDWLQLVNRKALAEVKLCRRRAIPINDGEMIPFLIRGLIRPELRSVMMGNPPATVNAFLTELRRLESISESPSDSTAASASSVSPPMSTKDSNSLSQAIETLVNQVSFLNRSANQSTTSGPVKPAIKQVSFDRRPPGTRNEIQCYNCNGFGHFARDCPHPNPRLSKPNSGNGQAAPSGQERQ
ncbi:uncharacterized protein LOC123467561 [Daphnia magna]|uniref:uncharacterized protein LOC123467561 n=1 Tax=Daphnia magna TaxID=35525 RepID=UPI001E1BDAE1|nr:uncharacterized protein LOC123467561 [Daphnia magna]